LTPQCAGLLTGATAPSPRHYATGIRSRTFYPFDVRPLKVTDDDDEDDVVFAISSAETS